MSAFRNTENSFAVFVATLLILLVIGYFDYITPVDLSFSLFYLIPISLLALYRNTKFVTALTSTVSASIICFLVEFYSRNGTSLFYPIWNSVGRLFIFSLPVLLIWHLKEERKKLSKAKQLLRLSEEKYRTIIENIGEGVAYLDPGEKFLFANRSAERIFGVETGNLEGAQLHDFITDEQYQFIQSETIKRSHGKNSVYELDILDHKRAIKKIVVTAVPSFDQNGTFLGTYGVFRDITIEKRAEEIYRKAEERFHAAFELPLVGYAIISVDKGWIEVNSALPEMLGYTKNELNSMTWADLTHPDDLILDETQFNRMLSGEIDNYTLEKRFIRKDGKEIFTSLSVGCVRNPDHSVNYFVALLKDISNRKLAEKALIESEQKYRTLTENSDDLILRFDRNFKHLYASPATSKYFGIEAEKFIGKTHQDLGFPKEDYEYWDRKIDRIFLTGQSEKEVTQVQLKDRTIYFDWHLIPEFDASGNVLSVLSYSKEITEIINAQKALELSEVKYRVIFANNPNPMVMYDPESLAFLEVNQSAIDLYGYSREEFLSMTMLDIQPPDEDKIIALEHIKYAIQLEDSQPNMNSWRNLKKNGELIYVEATGHTINIEGRIVQHVSIIDRTLQKQLEASLLSKTSLLEAQLNSVAEGILVLNQGFRILHNKRYEEIFTIPREMLRDTQHKAVLNYIAGLNKSPEQFIEKTNYLNNNPEEKSMDLLELSNGQIIERYSAPVLDKNGGYYGRIWTFRDITELKNAELEIKNKNSILQKTIADKDKFYSIIAHDLRGPIGGLSGMLELMADPSQYFSDEERKEFTIELSESAKSSFILLEQLLEWSRIERGMIDFKPQRLVLSDIVVDSLKPLSKMVAEKGVELLVEIPAKAEVSADRQMLQTIIRNLTSNAIKYTRQGGRVTILSTPDENNKVKIAVKDTGVGMNNQLVGQIYNGDLNVKRKGTNGEASSGLGLQLCREFVERHGGKINITSEEGKGSEFSFCIPGILERDEIRTSEVVALDKGTESQLGKIKLLIVEDDMVSSKLISLFVKNVCREILKVRTGTEAINTYRIHQDIDLILMDIQLPGVDGYEVTRQIRKLNQKVVIIAQTALARNADKEEALTNGCNDHIAKPFDAQKLNLLIQKYFKLL